MPSRISEEGSGVEGAAGFIHIPKPKMLVPSGMKPPSL